MKFLFPLILLFSISFSCLAQEGVITYEVRYDLRRGQDPEGIPPSVPERYFTKQALYFNAEASLYKNLLSKEEEQRLNGGTRVQLPQYDVYIQPAASKRVMLNYFNGRKYITQHSTRTLAWKVEGETKTILGYHCQKAIHLNGEGDVNMTAWFTTGLRPALGPFMYYTLPGAVLEIDINHGESVYQATQIDLRPLQKGEVVEPRKGKKVTQEQYAQMLAEYKKQLQKPMGNIKIIQR